MKLSKLLVIFLAGSIPALAATAQSQQDTTEEVSTQFPDQLALKSFRLSTPASSGQLFSREHRYHFSADNWQPEDAVCYTMRSYHIVRVDQDSDVTRMDGYTTCQPASMYQAKRNGPS